MDTMDTMDTTMTTNKQALDDQLARLWDTFTTYAARADEESKRSSDGKPFAETSVTLDGISQALDKLEAQMQRLANPGALRPVEAKGQVTLNGQMYEYDKGTAEHARFLKAMRFGLRRMSEREQERTPLASEKQLTEDMKAMTLADDTTGGYLASAEFVNDVLRQMNDISPVRQVARVVPISTATGALIPVHTGIQTAKHIGEVSQRSQATADLAFRLEGIPTPEHYAESVASRALVSDAKYDIGAELLDAYTNAAALLEGHEFVKGTGAGEMVGLDTAVLPSANVVTCADSTGHTIAGDDVQKLLANGLKAAYQAGAQLLVNPKVMGALRLLKATSGNTYLFPQADPPGYFCGLPFTLTPDMDDGVTPAAGKNVAYLMHPMAYALVVRQEVIVQRLDELLAEQGKILYYLWGRVGGQVVVPEAVARLVTA